MKRVVSKIHYRAKAKGFEEGEIVRLRKTRTENAIINHGEIDRLHEAIIAVAGAGAVAGGNDGGSQMGYIIILITIIVVVFTLMNEKMMTMVVGVIEFKWDFFKFHFLCII